MVQFIKFWKSSKNYKLVCAEKCGEQDKENCQGSAIISRTSLGEGSGGEWKNKLRVLLFVGQTGFGFKFQFLGLILFPVRL